MKVRTALILCAGYGKRLAPITNDIPKPLLKVKNINLLDNTLKFAQSIGINNIKINTFFLSEQIKKFIEKQNYSLNIDVVSDGEKILDTGGGIYNLIKHSEEEDFLTLNPDTLWNSNYINIFNEMEKYYFNNKIKNLLMVVKKNRSFDIRFKGDFNLKGNKLFKEINNEFIYTGCQILNRKIFQQINKNIFSMSEIWNDLLDKKELFGYESLNEFVHLTDIEIYKKLN
jgi:MurNAc alpha-1-phosphate uridylyltransferase